MSEETKLERETIRYLVNLGYPESSIEPHVKTREGRKIDLVVRDQKGPQIVIEVKGGEVFPSSKEPKELRFHPHVRQLQSYATELDASYYLLTDAVSYLWFTTDTSGRPRLLDQPVRPSAASEPEPRHPSRKLVLRALQELKDLSDERGTEPAFVILAKVLEEHGDSRLRQALLAAEEKEPIQLPDFTDLPRSIPNRDYLRLSFEILDAISLTSLRPKGMLSLLDKVFLGVHKGAELRVPRWLADSLVRLSQLHCDSVIVDICSHHGNLLAAIQMLQKDFRLDSVWGISTSPQSALWTRVQQAILDFQESRTVLGNHPPYDVRDEEVIPPPTHLIGVPPLGLIRNKPGERSALHSSGMSSSEASYLELAIEWVRENGRVVMVVPEAFLFSQREKAAREFISQSTQISAIIGLSDGAFGPYSSARTSILILDNNTTQESYDVFMSLIEDIPAEDKFNSREIPQVSSVIDSFVEWVEVQQVRTGSWTVPIQRLDPDNWTTTRYLPTGLTKYPDLTSSYPTAPLGELTESIQRGSSIKLDEKGSLPVIGPGAIRSMSLEADGMGSTVKENLSSRSITVQEDDLVFNNIGSYLGSVAIVDEELAGSFASQHVVVIRPDNSKVLPEYLAAALNSGYVKPEIERRATGTVIISVPTTQMFDIKIPLPELETQQDIVKAVKRAKANLHEKRRQLEQAETNFERVIQYLSATEEDIR